MYDPRRWPAEHKVALAIAMALGAAVTVFIAFQMDDAYSFARWAAPRLPYDSHFGPPKPGQWGFVPYALPGAAIGAALVYLVKLLR